MFDGVFNVAAPGWGREVSHPPALRLLHSPDAPPHRTAGTSKQASSKASARARPDRRSLRCSVPISTPDAVLSEPVKIDLAQCSGCTSTAAPNSRPILAANEWKIIELEKKPLSGYCGGVYRRRRRLKDVRWRCCCYCYDGRWNDAVVSCLMTLYVNG